MMRAFLKFGIVISLFVLCSGCEDKILPTSYRFELLEPAATGLEASNVLKPNLDFNVFNYMYYYNGGGVATGDFNQDGLEDIFFTFNQSTNRLYLNQGDLKFQDFSSQAGIEGQTEAWSSGCTVVDINQDGLLDIYVNQVTEYRDLKGHNQLWVCQGIKDGVPQFKDEAAKYGLDFAGFGTQAAFFDYDLDGDLDLYQLNHSVHENGTFGKRMELQGTQHELSGDRLYQNVDGQFKDVTRESGILSTVIGYGLGIATSDINRDGWPDIYISNDFHENDYLYINQKDGSFKEMLNEQINHTSRFSMGVDIADLNNDGYNEIFSLDMLPYDPYILKSSLGEDEYDIYHFKLGYGYNHQYARNNLQLNNGNNTFSEVGIFAGVHATDWSWATLLFDFDNDGKKDIFVSNGISKRMNDIDYVNFMAGSDASQRFKFNDARQKDMSVADKMPEIKLPNKFFLNSGHVEFADLETQIKNNLPTYSNGAVYADFDRDGDLDVVVNNIEDGAYLYRNLAEENATGGDYLALGLKGSFKNQRAIGARALVYQGNQLMQFENFPVRGFQSSVTADLHLGLGDASQIDSILLIWPDQSYQRIQPDSFNQRIEVAWQAGLPAFDFASFAELKKPTFKFEERSDQLGLAHQHIENDFIEFNRERLLPNMNSTSGPALAVGDANGDQLDDIFIGSSKWQRSTLYLQQADGTFKLNHPEAFIQDSVYEDVDALWLDIDNDNDQDLVVASGGNEFWGTAFQLQPRLYLNDGQGQLTRSANAFDSIYVNASCLAAHDINGDGAIDLFLGGATVPWNYGDAPESYLLINNGQGQFEDQTQDLAADLKNGGMVKDAFWGDMDQDNDLDLVVSYEWGPIRIFVNQDGQLQGKELAGTQGWWNNLEAADIDGDGDLDFIAGNLGLNSKLKASADQPVRLYIEDFDENGKREQLLTSYVGGKEVIFHNFKEVTMQMPPLKKQFLFAKDFAKASPEQLVGKEKIQSARKLEVQCLESSIFINNGALNFERKALPRSMQYSPVKASLFYDFDNDGQKDLMLGSNFYENNIELGRYDASYGAVLSFNDKDSTIKNISPLSIRGQIRQIHKISVQGQDYFLIARNNEQLLVLMLDKMIQ